MPHAHLITSIKHKSVLKNQLGGALFKHKKNQLGGALFKHTDTILMPTLGGEIEIPHLILNVHKCLVRLDTLFTVCMPHPIMGF